METHDRSQASKTPPGPSEPENFWESPLESFTKLTHQYGDIVSLDPNTHQIYLLNHPNDIKHVLQDNYRNYTKDADTFKLILGDGLFVSEGDLWLRQRRMMQPAFHRQNIEGMLPAMVKATTELTTRWQTVAKRGESIDVFAEMTEAMIDLSAITMFGADIKEDIKPLAHALTIAQEYVYYRGWDYLEQLGKEPSAEEIAFQEAVNTIDKTVYRIIDEGRKNAHKDDNNLLAMLLRASDENTGDGMSEKQLRDEVVTMLAGGQSTTAIALTWLLYTLSIYPDIEERVYTELVQVLGQRSPTFQDLPNLVYTRMVIDEVLRLYPPSWLAARRSIGIDEIGGYHIPEKSEIFICPYLIHRHPSFWENPEQFNPERFSPEQSAKRPHFAYIPFSGGAHVCIGNHFAIVAIQLVLAMIMQTYKLHLTNSERIIQPQPLILLQPQANILMTIEKRS